MKDHAAEGLDARYEYEDNGQATSWDAPLSDANLSIKAIPSGQSLAAVPMNGPHRRGVSMTLMPASAPLRVLLVTARYLPHVGGTEIHTYEVARRLTAAGNVVTVLTTDLTGKLPATEDIEGIHIIRVRGWPAEHDYYIAPGIYHAIMAGSWDIIHLQGYHTFVAPMAMLAAWRSNTPYVVTFHSGGHSSRIRNALRGVQQELLRPLLARAERLIAVSRFEAEFFRKRLRLPAEKFVLIRNGSYLPKVINAVATQEEGTLIISVGRLERYKGHHRVIGALPKLLKERPDIHLRIVGSGPYDATLRRIAQELGVAHRVKIGAIAGSDRQGMASVIAGAKLVILLSDYESQGMAVMEALALGRPVLVADTSALHELVQGGLVQATPLGSTPEEVAQAVLRQLDQPVVPAPVDLPTWEACAEAILALYQRTVMRDECAS